MSAAYYFCAWGAMFARDLDLLRAAVPAEMPLGVGALAGTSLPIDRGIVRGLLHFERVTANGLDTVSDVLVADGRILRDRLDREMITIPELESAARKQGINSVAEIKECRLETGGALTVLLASIWGVPVSTTHTITGAIIGVGALFFHFLLSPLIIIIALGESIVAIGVGVTMALVNAILPTVARRGGLAPIGLSALAAAPERGFRPSLAGFQRKALLGRAGDGTWQLPSGDAPSTWILKPDGPHAMAANEAACLRLAAACGLRSGGRGEGYDYPHDHPGHVSPQELLHILGQA